MKKVLWAVQAILAALFLFAGGMKLVMPIGLLAAQSPLPGLFMRVIGVCEVLGAVGLILPAALRIKERLMPLAAAPGHEGWLARHHEHQKRQARLPRTGRISPTTSRSARMRKSASPATSR